MSANAAPPDSLPAPLDALDDAERRRVLHDFARQSAPAPDFVALPERIAQQALRCPDAVALRFRGRELSYRDLDLLARRWAAVLRRHGAGPETAVAMCLPRCFAEVVGLLAILYSGAAFVPLDPEHPEQRLRDMLEDVRPRAVLTTPATRDKLRRAAGPTTPVLALRDDGGGDDGGGDGDEQPGVQPMPGPLEPTREQQLAYILFTSGSTGRPKGVQIEHRGLSNHVAWVLATLRATSGDVFLQSGSAAFDGSLWSFFAPLCCGARMVLAAPEEQADPRLLEALMRAEQVSIAKFVPSTLRLLLEHARPGSGHALRQLACGGEVLDATLAARVFRTFPDACLHNFYGPTEASVVSTAMQVTPRDLEQATLSIGRPVPGMRAYVLDEAMRPLPVGAVGELFVAGIGLARGYLGRPELDAQRFVELAWLPGERLYRTGDLVRWLADGRLGFLGRGDDQVKLRGLRIELGEIEAALLALPGVRQAAALVLGSTPQEQQLTGFVAGPARDTRELRAWREQLAQRLPLYMLPSRFVFVDAFETLGSGKIDRRALAAQHAAIDADAAGLQGLPESRAPRQGPRSALESELLDIWRAVLGRDDIVPEHDFFDLGGHSLHATRMVSQVRATLGIGLALREVFDKPTLRELAAEVERRLGAGEAGQALPPIHAVERTGVLPLSFSQRRMWLEHQMDPHGAAYNVYSALRLRGELDREALQHALDALCARHEAFRTRIVFEHGEPHAVLDPVRPATLRLLQPGESTATRLVAACAAEPFDLERGPLHRFALACLGEREHVLLLVMHHIVTDDWSRGIVLADLERLYGLARRGEDVALPPRPIDFVDFASWQRAHVDEASQQAQLHYWTQRLDGAPAPALPGDTARSRRDDNRGGHVALPLPRDWIDAVQRESVRLEATPFMLLLAVFQSMLARWCAQDDMCVAFPIANRTRVEAEGVVGSLVNTLLMRNQVDPARGFRDFLQEEVRPAVLGAFAHQDLPFDHLVKHLRRHGSARPGDVRVLFNVLNTPRQPLRFEGLQADYVELDLGTTQFDLSLGIDLASRKVLSLSYASQLFQRATIEALGHLFLLGVERAVRRPDAPLHTLWVAAPDELERIARWNAPPQAPAGSAEQTLPALLAGSRASHGAAVRDAQGATLSHAELWQRVGRLAESLRLHGIGRGCLVGLGLPRGADMLAAQLAVWQCGAAYVPLDPDYPQARLRDMIDDARLSLLLGTRAQRADWSAYGVPLLEAEAAASEARAAASAPPPEAPRPEDPAYVIYTSGSTGKPKGVVVPHRAVVNFLCSMLREPGMGPGDVLLAVTTLSFDIAVLELLLPLCAGACVAIASPEEAADAGALQRRMARERPTLMQATPATWRMLVEAGWAGDPGLRALVGGEALGRDLADAMLPRCAELWNMYGPTETTVWSSCWRVEAAPAPVRIGRPIADTRFHVLDPWGQPCPIGFGGELYIAGAGVASGYLRRPQLTAERFVDDPQIPGRRMYRTGDRGRWTHQGLLEHQGRLDHQVKLRGFRIELGEIESQLQAHPDVAQCLAMVREDSPGDQRLTAYVVGRAGTAVPAPSELREWLRARLPAYMVPQQLVELAQLPRLPNGKIRRDALPVPRPDPVSPMPGTEPAWATPAERELAAVWAEVLGVAPTARSDNFFDLGGHSLLAQRVIVEFARRGGPRLSPRRLVQESLGQLAAGVELAGAAPASDQGPATRRWGAWAALRARLGL